MATVRKAVIPAAGTGTRQYPATSHLRKEFFPLVDRDGYSKPVIQIAVEEAMEAGIEQMCIVAQPGTEEQFRSHFRGIPDELRDRYEGKDWAFSLSRKLEGMGERLSFVEQPQQQGLGHAIWCAREWVGDEPFMALLADHVFISTGATRCAAQLMQAYQKGSMTALTLIGVEELSRFGVACGRLSEGSRREVQITGFREKPPLEVARRECSIVGIARDRFLAHFGMHIFSPGIFEVLEEMIRSERRERGEFQLTTAQHILCKKEPYSGLVMDGWRYDIGTPLGLLEAQMALALAGPRRKDVEELWQKNLSLIGD